MLTAIQGTRALQNTQILPQAAAPLAAAAPITELRPADRVQRTAAVGSIPAALPLFSAATSPTLDKAVGQLASSPTEANARAAQAGFRVAIRSLDLNALNSLQCALDCQIKAAGDYRTQKFLSEIQVDLFMEIHAKGGKPNIPPLTMPPIPGKTPETILHGSLQQLNSGTSEANFKTARAGFRVALRSLSAEDLLKTKALVGSAVQTGGDYRTQTFLDNLLQDVLMEQLERGQNPPAPAPTMPPALGKAPAEIAANALNLLNSSSSQANFRTSLAAVRVAARDLSKEQAAALKAELTKAMSATSDYRIQVFLDTAARELMI